MRVIEIKWLFVFRFDYEFVFWFDLIMNKELFCVGLIIGYFMWVVFCKLFFFLKDKEK